MLLDIPDSSNYKINNLVSGDECQVSDFIPITSTSTSPPYLSTINNFTGNIYNIQIFDEELDKNKIQEIYEQIKKDL